MKHKGLGFVLVGLNLVWMLVGGKILPAQASVTKGLTESYPDQTRLAQHDLSQNVPVLPPPQNVPVLQAPPSLPLPNLPVPPSLSLPAPRCLRPIQRAPVSLFTSPSASSPLGTVGELAVEYALLGDPEQPVQIVLSSPLYPETKIVTLLAIADAYFEIGQPALVSQTLSQASLLVSQLDSTYLDIQPTQVRYFSEIAGRFAKIGNLDQAVQIARSHPNEYDQEETLVKIATNLAEVGKFDQALEITKSLKDQSFKQGDALSGIAQHYVNAGNPTRAFEMIQTLNSSCIKDFTLNDFVKQLIEVNNPSFAFQVVESIEDEGVKAEALIEVTGGYLKAGQTTQAVSLLSQALELIEKNNSDFRQLEMRVKIAGFLREAGQPQQAAEVLSQAWENYQKLQSSGEIKPSTLRPIPANSQPSLPNN
jgi:tetratricopeptide (TPR) repeat protein